MLKDTHRELIKYVFKVLMQNVHSHFCMYILRDRLSLLREPKISIKQQYREIPWCFMAMQFSFTELASVTGESMFDNRRSNCIK